MVTLQEVSSGADDGTHPPAPPRMTMRASVAADSRLMLQLYVDAHNEELDGYGWTLENSRTFIILQAQAYEADLIREHPQVDRLTLCVDGMPVGRLLVECTETTFHLVDISLLQDYRNRGFGAQLLEELCEEAGRAKVPLQVEVPKSSPAARLFQRLGFVQSVDLDDRWLLAWTPIPH